LKGHTFAPRQCAAEESKEVEENKPATKPKSKDEYTQVYPQPLMAFSELRDIYGISGRMATNLKEQGYKIPTEVQMGSLPLLLRPAFALGTSKAEGIGEPERRGSIAVAPTGSGKTLAFLIPLVNQIMQRRRTKRIRSTVCKPW
jgi:ATP-dependent RNA helicase DDX52/ROK1